MRKIKLFSSLALCLAVLLSGASCSQIDVSYLKYHDTIDGQYDKNLMYQNLLKVNNGDPGGLWVSEEEDPTYGGYCYMAITTLNNSISATQYPNYKGCGFEIYRSKDLSNWENCGVIDGSGLGIQKDDWIDTWTWAPELIRDNETGMYFLYFSASASPGNPYVSSSTEFMYDRMYLGVAMSKSPMGPYEVVTSESYYSLYADKNEDGSLKVEDGYLIGKYGEVITTVNEDGQIENRNGDVITKMMPPVNFGSETASKYITGMPEKNVFPCIDASFFKASNGKMYLSFVQHLSSYKDNLPKYYETVDINGVSTQVECSYNRNDIWIVEMKDHMTPDYSTLSLVSAACYKEVTAKDEMVTENGETFRRVNVDPTTFNYGERFVETDKQNNVNEGPFMMEHDGRYYMYHAPAGTGSVAYSICQMVSDSPLGPYKKITDYNPVIGINDTNDYMSCTGHNSFVFIGDEIFALYHCFWGGTTSYGRCIAADRVQWMYNEELGYDILYGNGPTLSTQPGVELLTGYSNIAKNSTISISKNGNKDTIKYLTDGLFTVQEFTWDKEFTSKDKVTIELEWESPQEVASIFIYNSADYYKAFKQIDEVIFTLEDGSQKVIHNLQVNPNYVNENNLCMRQGGSAIATFDPMKVTKIEFTISQKYTNEFEDGSEGSNNTINISEIYVQGKELK